MTPLIISPEVEARANEIREYAEKMEHRRTSDTSPGDFAEYSMVIPTGFRVAYSVDAGAEEGVWFRHLSVSVAATGCRTVPSLQAMQMIASLFGFTGAARYGTLPPDPDHVVHAIELHMED